MNIRVALKKTVDRSYTVTIESKFLKKVPSFLRDRDYGLNYCIITDKNVKRLYGDDLLTDMKKKGLKVSVITIAPGENSKKFATAFEVCEKMVDLGLRRDSCVIALGGGVIGDLAGFAASVYMRGVPFVNIPTTLLAMIDSAIGGKTGVNLEKGKNLAGTFYQPKAVLIDPFVLKTLSLKEFKNGLAEMVKHGVIRSRPLFLEIEKNAKSLNPDNQKFITKIIEQNVKLKTRIVKSDEEESLKKTHSKTSRMTLNYGHTIGHAVEKLKNYEIPHGEAVSIGMAMENIIAVKKKLLSKGEAERIQKLLRDLGLPVKLPAGITPHALSIVLKNDKKSIGGKVNFILPVRIGEVVIRDDIL